MRGKRPGRPDAISPTSGLMRTWMCLDRGVRATAMRRQSRMSHSVEHHLAVTPEAYDAEIRRFVPGYDAMLDEATEVLVRLRTAEAPLHVVDLGAGTGALSGRIAARMPHAKITLLDADDQMLARAETRLAEHR